MMNSTNKLSVIIPLYNAGDDFRTCMESLITQTWTALEIIIINDGSTDNSVEIAGNDSNLLIVFYVQIMPDDFVM
ncbi:glycosyltransferase, partial [Escherichia coli]|uniref:glycosyltransferase n=1 Tax=Escherichia coli TaxID=562 RepID=UPI003FD040E0